MRDEEASKFSRGLREEGRLLEDSTVIMDAQLGTNHTSNRLTF